MRRKFLIFIYIFPLFFGTQCLANICDRLESISDQDLRDRYETDCRLLSQFTDNKECFQSRSLNVDDIQIYRSLRLISRSSYEKEKSRKSVWDIYGPAPKTWFFWEEANFHRHQLQKKYAEQRNVENKPWKMTLSDLKDLHKQTIDNEILGIKRFIPFTTAPGEIRHKGNRTAQFRITKEQYLKLKSDPLVKPATPGGKDSLVTLEGNKVFGYSLKYTKSEYVESALAAFIQDLNFQMNEYLNFQDGVGPAPKLSPLEFALRMQRRYVSIHPFHEGCGRTSRLIQEMILSTLGFPYLPSGDLQDDVVTPEKEYFDLGRDALAQMNQRLSQCCISYGSETEVKSPDCRLIYDNSGDDVAKRIQADILNRAVCSFPTAESIQKLQRSIEEYGELISRFQSEEGSEADLSVPRLRFESKKEERKFIQNLLESLATPIAGQNSDPNVKLKAYTWVPSRKAGRGWRNNTSLFNWLVKGTADAPQNLASKGYGLYVSRNPYDSLEFGISLQDGSPLGGDPGGAVASANKQEPWLYEVEVSGNAKILHVRDKKVKNVLKSLGLYDDSIYLKASPNIIIDYSSYDSDDPTIERQDWLNIMLKQNNFGRKPFEMKFKQANIEAIKNLSFGERQGIIDRYKEKARVSDAEIKTIPFFRDVILPLQAKVRQPVRNSQVPGGQAHSSCGREPPSVAHQLIMNPCFSSLDLDLGNDQRGNPMRSWRNGYFWSAQNDCMEKDGSGIRQYAIQSLHLSNQIPCQRNQDLERRYLSKVLIEVARKLDQPNSCDLSRSLLNQESADDYLDSILIENHPFVTPSGKCAVISAGNHIEFVSKDLCAHHDVRYRNFLSQCH